MRLNFSPQVSLSFTMPARNTTCVWPPDTSRAPSCSWTSETTITPWTCGRWAACSLAWYAALPRTRSCPLSQRGCGASEGSATAAATHTTTILICISVNRSSMCLLSFTITHSPHTIPWSPPDLVPPGPDLLSPVPSGIFYLAWCLMI